jgi:hypothetical protein
LVGICLPGALPDLTLCDDDSITVFSPYSDRPGVLADILDKLRKTGFGTRAAHLNKPFSTRNLTSVQVYTSKDGA